MGEQKGVGYDNVGRRPTMAEVLKAPSAGLPQGPGVPLLLRWESALPVRLAELKAHVVEPPTLSEDGYMIAVYGVPRSDFKGDPKKSNT